MDTTSYWNDSAELPAFKKAGANYEVDVAIVGAGITGVTAAYLFKKAGCKVALIERGPVGGFDTSHTTAHLTCVTDTRLSELVKKFGEPTARAVWDSGRAAIDQIHENIRAEKINCDFGWIPGYLHAAGDDKDEREQLQREAGLASKLGFASEFMAAVPCVNRPGIKFLHQAKIHPLKYLAGLLRTLPGDGSHVFENSAVDEIESAPLTVKVGSRKIRCAYVFLATHTPLMGKTGLLAATLFQTKLYLYTSYAIGAKIPASAAGEAAYWDTAEPYHYLRIDRKRGHDYAIFGGEDYKTGQQKNTREPYYRLERKLRALFPDANVDHHWSGQVIETPDGLPYIGENAERQFVATGFGGNGMTFGTLGAMMAVDAYLKRKNPWQELYDVHRKKIRSTWKYLAENKDYPYYLVRDWLGGADGQSLQDLKPGQGKILKIKGHKTAVCRDDQGKVLACSPVCTHLGGIVEWNSVEKTWDCPCHGSRFAPDGSVLSGPAETNLKKIKLPAATKGKSKL